MFKRFHGTGIGGEAKSEIIDIQDQEARITWISNEF